MMPSARVKRIANHVGKLGSPDMEVGGRAERYLIRCYGLDAIPFVLPFCDSLNRVERFRAVWILAHARQPEHFEAIVKMCDDEDEGVRYDAVLGLGIHGDSRAVPILIKFARLRDHTRPGIDALRKWREANGRARKADI